jgi:hypothetical protein
MNEPEQMLIKYLRRDSNPLSHVYKNCSLKCVYLIENKALGGKKTRVESQNH